MENGNNDIPVKDLSLWKEQDILAYGIDLFNREEFYNCHDVMEYLWGFGDAELRSFYQGLLHLAVAMYHLSRDNIRGTKSLIDSGTELLAQYVPCFKQIDIAGLIEEARNIRKDLERNIPTKSAFLKIRKRGR